MVKYDYIRNCLKANDELSDANDYLQDMKSNGVRICNDGMPDARSPLTNGYPVRLRIARYREMYGRMYPHVIHVRNTQALVDVAEQRYQEGYEDGYHKALDDTIDSLSIMNSRVSVTTRIAGLRKMFKKVS